MIAAFEIAALLAIAWLLARIISWARHQVAEHRPSLFELQQQREIVTRERTYSEPHTTWDASAARQARLN